MTHHDCVFILELPLQLRQQTPCQYDNSFLQFAINVIVALKAASKSYSSHPSAKSCSDELFAPGLLAAVGDLQINLVNGTLCLSWTPPFTLDITNVDPDLYYTIEITSTADAENPSTISCNDCSSEYKFTVNNSSPCDSYTFIVVPVNGARNGTPSVPLLGSFIQGRCTN